MSVKEVSVNGGLKLNIKKTKLKKTIDIGKWTDNSKTGEVVTDFI